TYHHATHIVACTCQKYTYTLSYMQHDRTRLEAVQLPGRFVLPAKKEVIRALRLGAVCYKPLNEAELCQIYAGFR
ncbi:MAG: hypothetical protein QGI34_10740, partial [Candidatus Latescibacteria bacterium]|nr:hypothetical protein [Candidatus Latescibacterota bacterium]